VRTDPRSLANNALGPALHAIQIYSDITYSFLLAVGQQILNSLLTWKESKIFN
jgi:hypothetical protein